MGPQYNVTGPSKLSLLKIGKKGPWLYISHTHFGSFPFFFLSHWELPIDEDSMCDEVSHPMEIMAGKKSGL